MCFHVICPVLRASAVSSVHTPRCSHQYSPPTTLEDLAPISGSKQPARVLRGLEAPSKCWRSSQSSPPRAGRPPARRRKRECEQEGRNRVRTNGFELYGCRSPRRSIASADRRRAHASVSFQFIRADRRGHWPWPWRRLSGSMLRIDAERPFCTWLATHARAADTCRAVRARNSAGR